MEQLKDTDLIILPPNEANMLLHLEALFGEAKNGFVEIAYGNPGPTKANRFSVDHLNAAAAFASSVNKGRQNVYIGVAPRSTGGNTRGKRGHCLPSDFAFVDIDDGATLEEVVNAYDRIKPAFQVVTGRHPNDRVHLYFRLEDRVEESVELDRINAGLISHFGGDKKATGIERLLRLAGSVAWPAKEGRIPELVEIEIVDPSPKPKAVLEREYPAADLPKPTAEIIPLYGELPPNGCFSRYRKLTDGRKAKIIEIVWAIGCDFIETQDRIPDTDELFDLVLPEAWRECLYDTGEDCAEIVGDKVRYAVQQNRFDTHIEGRHRSPTVDWPEPTDPYATINTKAFPTHLLPPVLKRFVEAQSVQMGCDAGGLALACLVTCSATIPDRFKVQVQKNGTGWLESARIWGAVCGPPSSKKTPAISAALHPLRQANSEIMGQYRRDCELAEINEDKTPVMPPAQLLVQDCTVEALASVMIANPDGVLKHHDELSGFIGAMDKYNGGKVADTAFYLECWNGQSAQINRVNRGVIHVENASLCFLGGVQPEVAKKLFEKTANDGLLARFLFANLENSSFGIDEAIEPQIIAGYRDLIRNLLSTKSLAPERRHNFNPEGQSVADAFRLYCHWLEGGDTHSVRFSGWAGKAGSQFARLVLTLHYIKHAGKRAPDQIDKETCMAADGIMRHYFVPHAIKFFIEVIGGGAQLEDVQFVAMVILTRKLETITFRDLTRANKHRFASDDERRRAMHSLESFGWISPKEEFPSNKTWIVNPLVHGLYQEHAKRLSALNRRGQESIMEAIGHA